MPTVITGSISSPIIAGRQTEIFTMKSLLTVLLTLVSSFTTNGFAKRLRPLALNEAVLANNTLDTIQWRLIEKSLRYFPDGTEYALALIKNGQVSFAGLRRENDAIRPINNHQATFEIGSLTKLFTATLLADFVFANQVKLDDPIQGYLDFSLKPKQAITFRQLANHTAGLPRLPSNFVVNEANQNNPFQHYDSSRLKKNLTEQLTLQHTPGMKYAYSNLGSGLLAFTLTEMSDTSFEVLLQERLFKPYQMTNSSSARHKLVARLVQGQNTQGEKTPNWEFDALAGAGAVYSTVEDMAKFALAQFDPDNEVAQLTHRPTIRVGRKMSAGLGWHILDKKKGQKWHWHNGATGGYRSSMALDVAHKNGVIILSNVSAFHKRAAKIDELCFDLMATLKAQ